LARVPTGFPRKRAPGSWLPAPCVLISRHIRCYLKIPAFGPPSRISVAGHGVAASTTLKQSCRGLGG
jgi:hypothetical protein